jgi:negative regulator of genetic competence, sporulation and motility
MTKSIPSLSKMWLKVRNLESTLFPYLEEALGELTLKESKLIRILDFAQIEDFVSTVTTTNFSKHRQESIFRQRGIYGCYLSQIYSIQRWKLWLVKKANF